MTDLDRFLADDPARSPRDWKGKGFHDFAPFDKHHVAPGEQPWDKLDRAEVRRLATSTKGRFLPRNYRMAAARDPGLIWDERSRSYRLRAEATPAPQEATRRTVEGAGVTESSCQRPRRPAAATNSNANTVFLGGDDA